jgi:hypothetical protein
MTPRGVGNFCDDRMTASGKPVVYSSISGTVAVLCTKRKWAESTLSRELDAAQDAMRSLFGRIGYTYNREADADAPSGPEMGSTKHRSQRTIDERRK